MVAGSDLGPEEGELPGDGNEGSPMVTGNVLGPEVGEPPEKATRVAPWSLATC